MTDKKKPKPQAEPEEKPDAGLRRYLRVDPAIAETLEKAGLG